MALPKKIIWSLCNEGDINENYYCQSLFLESIKLVQLYIAR